MKQILIVSAVVVLTILSAGCVDTPVPAARNVTSRSSSSTGGDIDAITQASIDESARQSQEDAQRISDWITQQNQRMQDQANQMANQAAIDASNAAAAAAAAAAAMNQ